MNLRIIYIAITLLGLSVSSAYADYIQGHVVRIDRQQGEMTITLCGGCTGEEQDHVNGLPQPADAVQQVTIRAPWFPRCLIEGMMVFARGSFAEADTSLFEAVEVFPHKTMGSKDKTGVRFRFRHHRGRGQHKGHHGQ